MQSNRNPLVDPQPGDVIVLRQGWTRTVTRRVDDWILFESVFDNRHHKGIGCYLAFWRRACELPTAYVIRRGEDA